MTKSKEKQEHDWVKKLAELDRKEEYGTDFLKAIINIYSQKMKNLTFSSQDKNLSDSSITKLYEANLTANISDFFIDKTQGVQITFEANYNEKTKQITSEFLKICNSPFHLTFDDGGKYSSLKRRITMNVDKKSTAFSIEYRVYESQFQQIFTGNYSKNELIFKGDSKVKVPLETVSLYFKLYDMIRTNTRKIK
jgi:hypothetical protein